MASNTSELIKLINSTTNYRKELFEILNNSSDKNTQYQMIPHILAEQEKFYYLCKEYNKIKPIIDENVLNTIITEIRKAKQEYTTITPLGGLVSKLNSQ